MKRFYFIFILFLITLTYLSSFEKSDNILNLEIPDSTQVQILSIEEGSFFIGRITEIGDEKIKFETKYGVMTISIFEITDLKLVSDDQLKDGKYWFPNPNCSRLFFAPTGRMLKQGGGYFADYFIFFPTVTFGITDNFTLGGGFSILPGPGLDEQIILFTPKVGIKTSKKMDLAIGALVKLPESTSAGILYGVSTFGSLDKSVTFGLGYGYFDDALADKPIVVLGGELRTSRNISLVTENIADNYCGLRLYGSSLTFSVLNCIFSENEAISYAAGGGFSGNCTGEIMNCLITDNTAATGGGDWNSGGFSVWSEASVDFVNCTFVDNSAAYGAGLTVGGGGEATITNCILWGNSSDQIGFGEWNNAGGSLTVNYCDVQYEIDSIYVTPLSNLDWGDGNIDDDPLFTGTGDHPFSLQDPSLCVNAGIPDITGLGLPEYDLAGNPRMYGGRIDMGAYENQNVVVSSEEIIIPNITTLYQNYPNPFNPETTIGYQLPENGKVKLTVYNLKGQKMKTLVNDNLESGNHTVIWNGADDNNKYVASGIYFYKLETKNFKKTRKMILLK
ncbi:MAG: T9SS type A sorting domain-containing protein [Candidatus Cloacimonetes bacterium]|nr:T9SS type A sorting domain-containing protein [Candidatus Cloacimonadota bacterium]